MSVWDKLDSGLISIYSNYLRVRDHGLQSVGQVDPIVAAGGPINVSLQYTGDLAPIEALGFRPLWRPGPGEASGAVALADIERLADHPNVIKMSVGRRQRPRLDQSIPEIKANQVWSRSGSTFSGMTGAGVIVGVIDTGIDFRHPFFRKTTPANKTRIRRIWDQGLTAASGESAPDKALLYGATQSYGVEYTDAMIEAVLPDGSAAQAVRHRDCNGHGTHVASIAAGNGSDEFKYIGVAPEADLVVVKLLSLETKPVVAGVEVSWEQRFFDAVSYIFNVAKTKLGNPPVVINCSFGSGLGPHDGFSNEDDFLTSTLASAVGQVVVFAAGNDAGSNQHARIEFPAGGGSVVIPIELYDARTNRIDYDLCRPEDQTESVYLEMYYPAGATQISVEVDFPDDGVGFIAGPVRSTATPSTSGNFGPRHWYMTHSEDNQTLRNGRGTVERSNFMLEIAPKNKIHRVGTYLVKISSPGALTVHVWCDQSDYGLVISESDAAHPLPAIVHVEDRYQIGNQAAAENVITVAAYNAEVANRDVADFSSRGPLANYGGTPPQPQPKPDIAAPGVKIDAAGSRDKQSGVKKKKGTTQMDGTSMAAPHVTGLVALMLEKNHTLTVSQVLSNLIANHQTDHPAPAEEVGAGRIDAKACVDNVP